LSGCALTSFPASARLLVLEQLLLTDNDLTQFVLNFSLPSLRKISLDFNPRLKTVRMSECTNITSIDVSFTSVSGFFGFFPHLMCLKAIDTALDGVPITRYRHRIVKPDDDDEADRELSEYCNQAHDEREKLRMRFRNLSDEWSRLDKKSSSSLIFRKIKYFNIYTNHVISQFNRLMKGPPFDLKGMCYEDQVRNLFRGLPTPLNRYTASMINKIKKVQKLLANYKNF
jgi:hypothetical protein